MIGTYLEESYVSRKIIFDTRSNSSFMLIIAVAV